VTPHGKNLTESEQIIAPRVSGVVRSRLFLELGIREITVIMTWKPSCASHRSRDVLYIRANAFSNLKWSPRCHGGKLQSGATLVMKEHPKYIRHYGIAPAT